MEQVKTRVRLASRSVALAHVAGAACSVIKDIRAVGVQPVVVQARAVSGADGELTVDLFGTPARIDAIDLMLERRDREARRRAARLASRAPEGEPSLPPLPNARVELKGRSNQAEFARDRKDALTEALDRVESQNLTAFSLRDDALGQGDDVLFFLKAALIVTSPVAFNVWARDLKAWGKRRGVEVKIFTLRDPGSFDDDDSGLDLDDGDGSPAQPWNDNPTPLTGAAMPADADAGALCDIV